MVMIALTEDESPHVTQVFLVRDDDAWWPIGEVHGLGPGGYEDGETTYQFLSGGEPSGTQVEVTLGDEIATRRVENKHYLAVFWDAGEKSEAAPPIEPGFGWQTTTIGPATGDDPIPKLRRVRRD
jgi:hypothetical protein